MSVLLEIVLPVFLVIGFGYTVTWRRLISDEAVSGIMTFAQSYAIPCLLFVAIARLDLAATFDPALLGAFYIGATIGFCAGLFGARFLFGRPWEDCVAIGFATLFSNSVLMGLPLTERAYGAETLAHNFAIVALHAPFCYILGFVVMEMVRARGAGLGSALRAIALSVVKNGLMIGIALGFIVNLAGMPLPAPVWDALDLMARAGLPAALFGLGGVLYRYRPEGDLWTIAYICSVSLVLHPVIVWFLGKGFGLSTEQFRSAVVTAAMAPGVNAYIFANIFGVARRVVATSVLVGTALCVVTAGLWLTLIP